MQSMNWGIMAPEITIAIAISVAILLDLLLKPFVSRNGLGWVSLIGVAVAGSFVIYQFNLPTSSLFDGIYVLTIPSLMWKLLLLIGMALIILVSMGQKQDELGSYRGEYYYLLLLALLGGMFVVSTWDLLMIYVGLELLSISSYILVGIQRKREASTEAAWKYLVLGSVSSAFILYGMSFMIGLTGTTNIFEIISLGGVPEINEVYVYLSLFLLMVGVGFKVASAPFHAWVPDVYQGAPTSVTSFLAVVSKIAVLALFVPLLLTYAFVSTEAWNEVIAVLIMVLAALSMLVGNTVALRQTNVKRMMAYSSIANAGYALVPFARADDLFINGPMFYSSLFFYLLAYLFTTIGVFAVIQLVEQKEKSQDLKAFAGLHRRSPWLAVAMTLFIISSAGIPITAGFFGKFYIISGILSSWDNLWLVIVMLVTTVVSYYYYFSVIRQMYFRPAPSMLEVTTPKSVGVVISISCVVVIVLGILSPLVMDTFQRLFA
jgi:NADH-quinone oxidoreductase subunit N